MSQREMMAKTLICSGGLHNIENTSCSHQITSLSTYELVFETMLEQQQQN